MCSLVYLAHKLAACTAVATQHLTSMRAARALRSEGPSDNALTDDAPPSPARRDLERQQSTTRHVSSLGPRSAATGRLAEARSAAQHLVPQAANASVAENLLELLRHEVLGIPTAQSLIRATDAAPALLQTAVATTTPPAARALLFRALAADSALAIHALAPTDALERCFEVLAEDSLPLGIQEGVRELLRTVEPSRFESAVKERCAALQGPNVAATARILAALTGRHIEAAFGFRDDLPVYADAWTIGLLTRLPGALRLIVRALEGATPSVASDLAVLIDAVANVPGHRLLLSAGVVPLLLQQLPHRDAALNVAFALWRLAQSNDGEDALLKSNAAPLLLKATEVEDDSAKAVARALGALVSHPTGRSALAELARRALSSDRAMQLLGWTCCYYSIRASLHTECEVSRLQCEPLFAVAVGKRASDVLARHAVHRPCYHWSRRH